MRREVGNERESSFVDIVALGLPCRHVWQALDDVYVHFKDRQTEARNKGTLTGPCPLAPFQM